MRHALVLALVAIPLAAPAAEPATLVRLGSDRFRQAERVTAIAYSPDGRRLATADEHTVYVWDAADGRLLRTIPGSDRRKFVAVHFNADGTALFAVALDETMDAIFDNFDAATGKEVATKTLMSAGKDNYREPEFRFSPDGLWVAARRGDRREVAVMNTANRRVTWSESQADDRFNSLVFRADSHVLAVGGWDGQIRLVDPKVGRITCQYAIANSVVWSLAYSTDGADLVAGTHAGSDTDLVCFEASTGKVRWTVRTHSADTPFFTTDGTSVVYFGKGKEILHLWRWLDAATGKPLDHTMDTGWQEPAVRFDGKVLALGGRDGHVSQWDLTTRKRLADKSADPGLPVTELSFTADGSKVRGWANGWYEWDVKTGKQTRLSPPIEIGGSDTTFGSLDSKWLVRRVSGHFSLTEVGTGTWRRVGREDDRFWFLAGGRLVRNGPARLGVYDPKIPEPLVNIEIDRGAVAASVDGTTAVAVTPAGDHFQSTRYDLATGKPVGEWDGRLPDPALMDKSYRWQAALSPGGRVLAVFFTHVAHPGMGFDRIEELHTALFDARTGRYLSGWWDLHSQAELAFSPDGRTVACFYRSGLGVDVREVATGKRRARRSSPPVSAACFTPDGRTLALATSPGPVALWDLIGKPDRLWVEEKAGNWWDGLAAEDAEDAFDVIRQMRQHPAQAVPFLKERVKVPTAPAPDWIAARIKNLDADQFRDREKATADLAGAGELVVPALRAALKTAPAEARRRLESLLEQAGKPTPETWRAVRVCEALEGIGTPEARDLLATWAKGPPSATLTREAAESVERLAGRR